MPSQRCLPLLLVLAAGHALACEADPAVAYLKTIESMDWDAMEAKLHPDARYHDPTMTFYDRDAIDLQGRRAIVDFWRSSSDGSGTSGIDYTYRECFDTAGYHVVHYDLAVTVAGAYWNLDRETIDLTGVVTSIFRIIDDRVVEHRDYVDYASAEDEIADLRKRYGTISE